MSSQADDLESDPRFPSGPWTGFFLHRPMPGRHLMEMQLTFRNGTLTGEGRDWVGAFRMRGRYFTTDGTCHWTKHYIGQHDVYYKGYNEGKGIWGVWEIGSHSRGGFHIWPEGMPDPTQPTLREEADLPVEFDDIFGEEAEEVVPAAPGPGTSFESQGLQMIANRPSPVHRASSQGDGIVRIAWNCNDRESPEPGHRASSRSVIDPPLQGGSNCQQRPFSLVHEASW